MINMFWKGFSLIFTRMIEKPLWMMLLISLCIMSLVYTKQSVWDLPVAVVDNDHSKTSQTIARNLNASPKIAVKQYDDLPTAQRDLALRKLFTVIILPHNLEKQSLNGKSIMIPAYGDNTNRLANGQIQLDVLSAYQSMTLAYNQQILLDNGFTATQIRSILAPIQAQTINLFNPGTSFAAITLPGLMVMLLQHSLLIAGTRTSITLHTLPQGKPPLPMYLGCLTALIPIWLFLSVILFVIWPMLLGYRQTAPIPEILLLTLPFILATLGLVKFITECLRSIELMYLTIALVTTPVFYLSGTIWPLQSMPGWVAFIAKLLPSTWATKILVGVNQMGLSITEVGFDVLMLLVLGFFYAVMGWVIGGIRDGRWRVYGVLK